MEGLKPAYTRETQNSQREKSQFDRTDGLGGCDKQGLTMAGKKRSNFVMKMDWQKYISNSPLAAHRICCSGIHLSRTQVFQEVLHEGAWMWHRWWTSWWSVTAHSIYDTFCLWQCSQTWGRYMLAIAAPSSWMPSAVSNSAMHFMHCCDIHTDF